MRLTDDPDRQDFNADYFLFATKLKPADYLIWPRGGHVRNSFTRLESRLFASFFHESLMD